MTGFSVGEYIITCRIKKACMLLNSNMPIQEISGATGFGDPTHFNRTFKKRMGVTPALIRKTAPDGTQKEQNRFTSNTDQLRPWAL